MVEVSRNKRAIELLATQTAALSSYQVITLGAQNDFGSQSTILIKNNVFAIFLMVRFVQKVFFWKNKTAGGRTTSRRERLIIQDLRLKIHHLWFIV